MRNITLRHSFPRSRIGRSMKSILPGAVLALLATPALATEQPQGNVLTLGGGVDVSPRYSGSDKSRVSAAQVVDYAMANGFFVSTTRGIGYGNSFGKLDYNAALSYRAGRKDRDVSSDSIASGSDDLRGMGDIKGSAIVVPGLGYRVTDWLTVQLQAEVPVSERDNGEAVHFGIASPLYTSPKNALTLALTIYAYSLNLDWTHKLTSRWSLLAAAGVTQLTGEAGDSPIVQRKTSPVGSLKVTYSF
ncbi:MAG: MipA/OmpV family protein [Enterobacter sp.]|nr:MipA/OmpV family protein [Enterobacter sp.]